MEIIQEFLKGIFGFCTVVGTGYCVTGLMCVFYGGMAFADLPDWWWLSAVVTAFCAAVGLIAGFRLVLDLRWEKQEARRLGYVTMEKGKVVYRK